MEAHSTVGSGDAYLAGLLAGTLHRKLSSVDAVRLAAGCAAANAETLGAGAFEARRAEELAESVEAEILSSSLEAGPRLESVAERDPGRSSVRARMHGL